MVVIVVRRYCADMDRGSGPGEGHSCTVGTMESQGENTTYGLRRVEKRSDHRRTPVCLNIY